MSRRLGYQISDVENLELPRPNIVLQYQKMMKYTLAGSHELGLSIHGHFIPAKVSCDELVGKNGDFYQGDGFRGERR